MNAFFIALRRGLRHDLVQVLLAAAAVALSCALLLTVRSTQSQAGQALLAAGGGFDGIVGSRGSQMQLVLCGIYHLEPAPGNLSWSLVKALQKDRRVISAVPICVGDNYRGFRIVATSESLFSGPGLLASRAPRFQAGRGFDPLAREAVLGSLAAKQAGLKLGDSFSPFHGLSYNPDGHQHLDQVLTVVGILEATGTPADRVIWTPLETHFRMSGHVLRGGGGEYVSKPGEEIPEEVKEVSAVLIRCRNPLVMWSLKEEINLRGSVATMADVRSSVADFSQRLDGGVKLLGLVAMVTAVSAALGILGGTLSLLERRRREFAVLRVMGARRRWLAALILAHAASVALLGALTGGFLYLGLASGAAAAVQERSGLVLQVLPRDPVLAAIPAGMVILALFAALLPAWQAYRGDLAANLGQRE
ncbi:MAG: hypothetical protein RL095_396 [Verrucomicrobiota bacterium]|jgi:putative ABC transport system permease protein